MRAFDIIRNVIESKPLFVLFERKLNCNPATDHESPKNVFPLFSERIFEVEKALIGSIKSAVINTNIKITDAIYPIIHDSYEDFKKVIDYL